MSEMPRFSVIIPTYNRAALLADTLASVFSQRFTDFEVLIVDDGSTDETERVLSDHASRIRVWTQAHRGPGAARNVAAEQARGRYLAFIDSDDVWFPWTLDLYDQAARDAGEPAFIAGKPAWFRMREQRARERREILTRQVRPVMIESLRRRQPDAWCMYKATLPWHVSLGRWRFLAAFPLMTAFRAVRS